VLQLSHSQSAQLFWVNLLKRAFAKRTTSESPAERTHLGTLPFFLSALQKLGAFRFSAEPHLFVPLRLSDRARFPETHVSVFLERSS